MLTRLGAGKYENNKNIGTKNIKSNQPIPFNDSFKLLIISLSLIQAHYMLFLYFHIYQQLFGIYIYKQLHQQILQQHQMVH